MDRQLDPGVALRRNPLQLRLRQPSRLFRRRHDGDQSATQPNPDRPLIMNDQRHEATSIRHAQTLRKPSPKLETAEIATIAVPRSV